jgi:hypothetical protein
LFKDGSAVITDITLLALAAIFLNWAVRLPWYAFNLFYLSAVEANLSKGLVLVCASD